MVTTPRDWYGSLISALTVTALFGLPVAAATFGWSSIGGARAGELVELLPQRAPVVFEWQADEPASVDAEEEVTDATEAPAVEEEPVEGIAGTRDDGARPDSAEAEGTEEEGAAGPSGDAVASLDGAPGALAAGEGEGEGADGLGERGEGAGAGKAGGKKKRPSACLKEHDNIHPLPDGSVTVDRSLVSYYTKNLERFMSLGYSKPYDEEGVEGFYISGFGCTSPVYKAGFRRGDVLLTVNGKKTRTWIGVFMLYQKLKHRDDFEIQLVRKGEPMSIRFTVVDG